jgi:hypothetical protein
MEREALELCDYLECNDASMEAQCEAAAFIRKALAQPAQEPDALTIAYQSGYYDGKQAALAQPAQEPVAWMSKENDCIFFDADKPNPMDYDFWTPLYTAPPQRPWVGLTEKDFSAINQSCLTKLQAATSAESILRERNL